MLQGLEDGLSVKEIAERESMNIRTVERSIRSMMDKAGVSNLFLLGRKLRG